MARQVINVFAQMGQAQDAIDALQAAGCHADAISLVTRDGEGLSSAPILPIDSEGDGIPDVRRHISKRAERDAWIGGGGGLLLGLLLTLLPGVVPMLGLETLTATVGAAVVGSGIGGLLGALIGMGIAREQADDLHEAIRRGWIMVSCEVRVTPDGDRLQQIMATSGGILVHEALDLPVPPSYHLQEDMGGSS